MISKIYSVYDSKAEQYMTPIFFQTKGLAVRAFAEAVNDGGKSQISKYPADFVLFELGEFDGDSCSFNLYPAPVNVGVAVEFVQANQEA